MRVTSRGWKVILAAVVLAISSTLLSDILLTIATISLIVLMAFSLFILVSRIKHSNDVRIEPSMLEVKVKAGERRKYLFKIYSRTPFAVKIDQRWISCKPIKIMPPESLIELSIGSHRSGAYELTKLEATLSDNFNLFEEDFNIPLKLRVEIYPRVLPWIMEALKLLGEAGSNIGEVSGKRKGSGLEYLWTREYQPGDQTSFIDWKATARLQKIMVKDFLEEHRGTVKIIYDIRAHGEASRDECASYFLSSIISFSRAGLPISITIKDGDQLIINEDNLDSLRALKLSLAYISQLKISEKWSVYELIEPKSARALMRILRELGLDVFHEIVKLEVDELLKNIRRILKKLSVDVIYIGCILIDSSFVKELASEISDYRGRLTILTPPKPWLDAKDLEEAYLMHLSNQKLLNALKRIGTSFSFEGNLVRRSLPLTR